MFKTAQEDVAKIEFILNIDLNCCCCCCCSRTSQVGRERQGGRGVRREGEGGSRVTSKDVHLHQAAADAETDAAGIFTLGSARSLARPPAREYFQIIALVG